MKKILFLCTCLLIACFLNAQHWDSVGAGLNNYALNFTVLHNELYAGGGFTAAGENPAQYVAKWDGATWFPLGLGTNSQIEAIGTFNENLYVGGNFTVAGSDSALRIAKWDGAMWSPLGLGINGTVYAIVEYAGFLYAAGSFTIAGGIAAHNIAKWDGTNWSAVGSGLNSYVNTLAVVDGTLYAGGGFTLAGGKTANRIASWDGSEWSPLGSGTNDAVNCIREFEDKLYVGGSFTSAGTNQANHIASWDGAMWAPVGDGFGNLVLNLEVYDSSLYAVSLIGIKKLEGTQWNSIGAISGIGSCIQTYGDQLYLGGDFDHVSGIAVNNIARYSISTLPLTLTSFTAIKNDKRIILTWETAHELNTDYFDIERSTSNDFKKIATINSNGTASQLQSYSYIDNAPLPGTNFYRLKQVDKDGQFSYSKVVSAIVQNGVTIILYPNPVHDVLNIKGLDARANYELSITNTKGEIVAATTINSTSSYNWNLQSLSNGVYYLNLTSNNKETIVKFLKE